MTVVEGLLILFFVGSCYWLPVWWLLSPLLLFKERGE